MGIYHKFVSMKPDGPDTSVVRPSDQNASHNSPPFVVPIVAGTLTATNLAAASTELATTPRTRYDLTFADQVRLIVHAAVAASTNTKMKVQYSTDQSAWNDLLANVAINGGTGVKTGSWENVPAGAKGDVYLRVMTQDGDGAADPQFRNISLQVR